MLKEEIRSLCNFSFLKIVKIEPADKVQSFFSERNPFNARKTSLFISFTSLVQKRFPDFKKIMTFLSNTKVLNNRAPHFKLISTKITQKLSILCMHSKLEWISMILVSNFM
jgi:hypothetical protein